MVKMTANLITRSYDDNETETMVPARKIIAEMTLINWELLILPEDDFLVLLTPHHQSQRILRH